MKNNFLEVGVNTSNIIKYVRCYDQGLLSKEELADMILEHSIEIIYNDKILCHKK